MKGKARSALSKDKNKCAYNVCKKKMNTFAKCKDSAKF